MGLAAYDVSEWGFFRFMGEDVRDFLQGLVTADLKKLQPGECLPACVLSPKGLLMADCELYEESPGIVLAVTRPAAVVNFLKTFDKRIMLSKSELKPLRAQTAWLVVGRSYTAGLPWPRLLEPSRLVLGSDPPEGAELFGLEEFEKVRVASGFPWYGQDMDSETLPLEARQEAAISLDKGCYMGQETVSRLVYRGHVNRRLAGLKFSGAAPAPGTPVLRDGTEVGKVTSSAGSLALAMVKLDASELGQVLTAGGASAVTMEFPSWPEPLKR
jgi:folate-binding protein YgfZ